MSEITCKATVGASRTADVSMTFNSSVWSLIKKSLLLAIFDKPI